MASVEHLDLLVGEALESIVEAAQELRQLSLPGREQISLHLGKAVGELWEAREEIYRTNPGLKRDLVKEYEQDKVRWETLNDIFMKACVAEDSGEIENSRLLFQELLKTSRFGYFRLVAQAGLYRLSVRGQEE